MHVISLPLLSMRIVCVALLTLKLSFHFQLQLHQKIYKPEI